MTNYYDVARMANTMGMKTTIELDPTQITVRVKNSIKRQLRAGRISGGWRSNAAKIAEQIVLKHELPVARDTWQGIHVGHIPMETKRRLLELVEADWSALMLESPAYTTSPYYKRRFMETRANLTSRGAHSFYVSFSDKQYVKQAQQLMTDLLTDAERERIEKALETLDSTDLIHITTYQ